MLISCSSHTSVDYGISFFKLGSSEDEIIEMLDKRLIEYRYEGAYNEGSASKLKTIRIKKMKFDDVMYGTIRISFYNRKVCFMEFKVHDTSKYPTNIDNFVRQLYDTYGDPSTKNPNVQGGFAKYYWGDNHSKFMILENNYVGGGYADFKTLHVVDMSSGADVIDQYKNEIFGFEN
jgi:hypothetical protein